jgi:hypothetical protein
VGTAALGCSAECSGARVERTLLSAAFDVALDLGFALDLDVDADLDLGVDLDL